MLMSGSPPEEEEEKILYQYEAALNNVDGSAALSLFDDGPQGKRLNMADTKVVKFEQLHTEPRHSGGQFTKEQVATDTVFTSSLAKELEGCPRQWAPKTETGRKGLTSKNSTIKIFVGDGEGPLSVKVDGPCSVQDLIEKVLFLAEQEDRELDSDEPNAFALYGLLHADEEASLAGLAPLERGADIHKAFFSAFALAQIDADNLAKDSTEKTSEVITVACLAETHTLRLQPTQTLAEALQMLALQTSLGQLGAELTFFYLDVDLEVTMTTRISDLRHDQLRLVNKFSGSHAGVRQSSTSATVEDVKHSLTREAALAYSEYTLIKINARGKKQKRVFGIDGSKIYNKAKSSVKTACRPMSSVLACQMDPAKKMAFTLCFYDSDKKKNVVREYHTETIAECVEIVAKIKYLLDLNTHKSS